MPKRASNKDKDGIVKKPRKKRVAKGEKVVEQTQVQPDEERDVVDGDYEVVEDEYEAEADESKDYPSEDFDLEDIEDDIDRNPEDEDKDDFSEDYIDRNPEDDYIDKSLLMLERVQHTGSDSVAPQFFWPADMHNEIIDGIERLCGVREDEIIASGMRQDIFTDEDYLVIVTGSGKKHNLLFSKLMVTAQEV